MKNILFCLIFITFLFSDIIENKIQTDWGEVKYDLIVNEHHPDGGVAIHWIMFDGVKYIIKETENKDYDSYFREHCRCIMMYNMAEVDTMPRPVFGIDRDMLYRDIFDKAEKAIINDRK